MFLLAAPYANLDFAAPFYQVHAEWNGREPLLGECFKKLINLVPMQQEFTSAHGFVIPDIAVLVRPHVAIEQPRFRWGFLEGHDFHKASRKFGVVARML